MDVDATSPFAWIPVLLVLAVVVGLVREAVVETVVFAALLAGALVTFQRMSRM